MKKQAASVNNGKSNDIWSFVKEDFDEKLPRRTAVFIKEADYSLPFAYPENFGNFGWNLDNREETTYDESPIVTLAFGNYASDLAGKKPTRNTFYFNKMEYFPSLVKREVVFSNFGLEVQETFCQSPQGGFCWHLDLTRKNHPRYELNKKLYAVVTFDTDKARLKHHASAQTLEVQIRDKKFHLTSEFTHYGFYKHFDGFLTDLSRNRLSNKATTGKYLILEYTVCLKDMEMKKAIRFGMSFQSRSHAMAAFTATGMADKIRDKWNQWFSSLPTKKFLAPRDRKAYYKCWWVIRLNYLKHPRWGKVVLEAFPVYRGFWQWGFPAVEWHSRYNPEIGPAFLKKIMNLFLEYQRSDGFVTHAIYLDEKIPGEGWGKMNIIQTPHLPWVALRYFNVTQDVKSLKSWYPRLVKYYHYINDSRDKNFFNLHLWAILTSYDTGLDTTSAFQKVTYGENGVKEKFCYPAIFAAERCRYEQAMARMSKILGKGEEAFWLAESRLTLQAMNRVLWDKKKKWYGVVHEDRTLDTRVGVDGLFPFAYRLVDKELAGQARSNFKKLIGPYGVYTVAPGEPGFCEETYWRGPVWPKSCSVALAAAKYYYPDLAERVKNGLVEFILKYPSVWECMNVATGKIARGDCGLMATPVVSSNVGAGEAMGALLTYYGTDMFSMDK